MPRPLPNFATVLTRRILPALVIAIAVVAGTAAIVLWFDVQEDQRNEQMAAARSAADAVAAEVDTAKTALRAIAKAIDSIEGREGSRTGLLEEAGRTRGVAAVMLVSSSDTITDVVLPPESTHSARTLIGMNLARLRAFAEARDRHEPRLASGLLDERRLIVIVDPLERGSLLLLIDPAVLAQTKTPTDGGFIVLLDEAGMPFSSVGAMSAAAISEIGRTVAPPPRMRPSALAVGETAFLATRLDIPGTPWTAMLCSVRSPVYVSYYRAVSWIAGVALLVAGATAVAVRLLARHATVPLRELPAQSTDGELPGMQPFAELDAISHRIRDLSSQLQEKNLRLRRVSDILAYVAEGPASRPYHDFFQALAYELAAATQARCVLITEWLVGAKPRAAILAARCVSALPDDFRYELVGNPCHQLTEKPFIHIEQGAAHRYPESPLLTMVGAEGYVAVALVMGDGSIGGHIEIISDQQLIVEPELRDLLSAVATRSSAELERIRANRQLHDATQRHDALRADTSEYVFRWLPSGTITYANEAMARWYGDASPSLTEASIFSLLREEDRPRLSHHLERLEVDALPLELSLGRPDEPPRRLRIAVRAIRDKEGRVTEYQGTATDMTATRALEAELSDSLQLVELIRSNVPLAIWISDWINHRCVWSSAGMSDLWPVSPKEMAEAPMAWTTAIHEEDRQRVVRSFLLHAAEGLYHEQYRIHCPDGSYRWIRDKAVPIRGSDGSVVRVVNFAEELSDASRDAET